ncbi:hypothetical protein, partial [Methanohalobium sp.]|uniref:hypothetical protein n=1 Tax=Methanohalobium sp. TaxID=2837493 RepID=UPI0025D8BF95
MRFNKGLNKDVDPSAQPEGTYRHLQNGVLNDVTGAIATENYKTNKLSGFSDVIGTITVPERDSIYLFAIDNGDGIIREYNYTTNTDTTILSDGNFNGSLFSNANYIDGEYSIDNEGHLILYWTDGVNPPRFYNVDKGKTINNVRKLNIFPDYAAEADTTKVSYDYNIEDQGGNLSGGTYQLAFAYIDDDQTLTDYFLITQPIKISRDKVNTVVNKRIPLGTDDEETTSKAIKLTLNSLDTSYDRLRISAIKGTQVANVADITINTSSIIYTYTGSEDETVGSLDEIVIDQPQYETVNTITEYDNQLYMGGLKSASLSRSERIDLQATALNIETDYTVDTGNTIQDDTTRIKKTGFKRGEVYAFYISFIKESGRETPAFHIPGRPSTIGNERDNYSNSGVSGERFRILAEPDSTHTMGFWENEDESYPDKEPFATEQFTDASGTKTYSNTPVRHHRFPGPTYTANRPTNINGSRREANISGVTFKNINIPSSLVGKLVGYKIYYAKRDDSDKLILDQGSFQNGWLDEESATQSSGEDGYRPFQQGDKVFKDDVYCTHGFDELHEHDASGNGFTGETWGSDQFVLYGRPTYSLINRPDISRVSHIRGIEYTEHEHQPSPDEVIFHNAESNRTTINSGDSDWIRNITNGPVYVDKNQRNVDLEQFGFSYKMDNLFGESKVVLETQNGGISRGRRFIFDMCQQIKNVYHPYDNQELVNTGGRGYIDGSGNAEQIDVFGGDCFISKNTFKANTLLALADDGDSSWDAAFDDYWLVEVSDGFPVDGTSKRKGVRLGIQEEVGTKGNINITPLPYSHSYDSYVESRIPTDFVSDGDGIYNRRSPRTGGLLKDWRVIPNIKDLEPSTNEYDTSNSPPNKQILIARGWSRFFIESDNYPEWNEEYASINDTKPNFAWDPYDITNTDNYNRIIRSSGDTKSGRSESFRRFLEEDFIDVDENRGEVVNLTEFNDNLLIHMERTLIQTRGRERLQTSEGTSAFIGTGDIFEVAPKEFSATELGFGGLDSFKAQVKSETGYFWVDKDARSIYHLSSQGLKELTTEQFGLSAYFDNLLRNQSSINVGYDANEGRSMFTIGDDTISYYPDRGVWASFHEYTPSVYVDYLDTLAYIGTNNSTLFFRDVDATFNDLIFTFAVPHGVAHKANAVWFNADRFDSSGNITQNIPFTHLEVENENQTTSRIALEDYDDSNTPTDITNVGNLRRVQGVWRFNVIRETDSSLSYLPGWAQEKRLEDDYHLVTLETDQTEIGTDFEVELSAAGLMSEQTA